MPRCRGRSMQNQRHSNLPPVRRFSCWECDKTFKSKGNRKIHYRTHTGERPFGCRFCRKAFADGSTLKKHERVHTGEKPYVCAVCPMAFNQRVVLREHIRTQHSVPDPSTRRGTEFFRCAVCAKLFHNSADLVQHLIQHSEPNSGR